MKTRREQRDVMLAELHANLLKVNSTKGTGCPALDAEIRERVGPFDRDENTRRHDEMVTKFVNMPYT